MEKLQYTSPELSVIRVNATGIICLSSQGPVTNEKFEEDNLQW